MISKPIGKTRGQALGATVVRCWNCPQLFAELRLWARQDLNLEPSSYEPDALTD
jgi:hypothetical protein